MFDDTLKITGRLRLQLLKADGSEQVTEVDNLVVSSGKNVIADRMKAAPALAAMSHIAVGTGAVAPTVADTQLGAEVAGSRSALATAVVANVITYTSALGPGVGTGLLAEAGLFNAAAAGQMLARTTFIAINKEVGDTLNTSWTVTVG